VRGEVALGGGRGRVQWRGISPLRVNVPWSRMPYGKFKLTLTDHCSLPYGKFTLTLTDHCSLRAGGSIHLYCTTLWHKLLTGPENLTDVFLYPAGDSLTLVYSAP
jgi:hypothetical protein